MSVARRALLATVLALSGCSLATATVAVGSAAVSVTTTVVGVATDVAVATVKGAAKVTGAVIDTASGSADDQAKPALEPPAAAK